MPAGGKSNFMTGKLPGLVHFMPGAQAPGTQVHTLSLAVNDEGGGVNIGHPAAVGMPLGMAYVMAKLCCFTT